jgi:MarR family transcriptional regulator, lower aerobic nicotinate degradation pathway regulator
MVGSLQTERVRSIRVKSGNSEITVPIRRNPVALARRLFQIGTAVAAEALRATDLTPLQYAVLAYLSDEPDLDQAALAARVGVDRTNIGLLVQELEAKDLVTRRVNGDDRRARLIRLTARGARLFRAVGPRARAAQAGILKFLAPAERELLIELMVRVIQANEAYARPGAGRRRRTGNKR